MWVCSSQAFSPNGISGEASVSPVPAGGALIFLSGSDISRQGVHPPVSAGSAACLIASNHNHHGPITPDHHMGNWGYGVMVAYMSTVITILNPKGGVSKTVTAMFLATALSKHGETTVIDADPQASATEWAYNTQDAGEALPFEVVPGSAATIRRALPRSEYVIIDTPPGVAEVLDAAAGAADLVLIPTLQSSLELSRAWAALDAIGDTPAGLFLARAETGSTTFRLARAALDEAAGDSVHALESFIPKREAIRQVAGVARPRKLYGYDALTAEVLTIIRGGQHG